MLALYLLGPSCRGCIERRAVRYTLHLGGESSPLVELGPDVRHWLVGRLVLRLNPALLLGAIAGAMTSGAALSVVNSAARSSAPALGYTGAYAFANVILTIAGTLIVRL